jgi:hypothetical protein
MLDPVHHATGRRGGGVAARGDWRLPMPSHKFHVGDTVMLKPSISRNVPGGVYEVIKQLPHNGREYEYHIKSANEEHQRIAGEGEMTKA